MSKETEYRQFAAEWFELAKRSDNQEDRTRRVTMAEAWLDLVEARGRATLSTTHWFKRLSVAIDFRIAVWE